MRSTAIGWQHDAEGAINKIKDCTRDGQISASDFLVGYEDRFLGVLEKPFTAFEAFGKDITGLQHSISYGLQHILVGEDIAGVGRPGALAIPTHRIRHIK